MLLVFVKKVTPFPESDVERGSEGVWAPPPSSVFPHLWTLPTGALEEQKFLVFAQPDWSLVPSNAILKVFLLVQAPEHVTKCCFWKQHHFTFLPERRLAGPAFCEAGGGRCPPNVCVPKHACQRDAHRGEHPSAPPAARPHPGPHTWVCWLPLQSPETAVCLSRRRLRSCS